MSVVIKVTKEDILSCKKDNEYDLEACPLAVAIKRHLKKGYHVYVYPTHIRVWRLIYQRSRDSNLKTNFLRLDLPPTLRRFVKDHEEGKKTSPRRWELSEEASANQCWKQAA